MRLPAVLVLLAVLLGVLSPASALAAPTPSPGATPLDRAGTSFLTAAPVTAGQPVRLDASTGDYLYWSFPGAAGDVTEIAATLRFPTGAKRSGPSTWSIEVFDGLRRRQACTAGAQTPTVAKDASEVRLDCVLRRVRSWAEPWSGDPLPGTYYAKLSVVELPEADLGLPVEVDLLLGTTDGGADADDGELRAPLAPPARPGAVLTATDGSGASPSPAAADDNDAFDWVPAFSTRWIWTTVGGVLAAVAGVFGFSLTWRRR
ncbi:peptidase [Plantactinospora sp. KLBMP9567]|nr:peptidase [Plantactinospora sp. KLBMP9567]MDW5326434.1 peptidase [Plantactinospora sp. KLBMP9567]